MRGCLVARLSAWRDWRLISLDVILAPTDTLIKRLKARAKGVLFSAVDQHLLYFRDTGGYECQYRIAGCRIRYVPFKVNCWDKLTALPPRNGEGDYFLAAGRTRRDVGLFLSAAKLSGVPCVLLHQQQTTMRQHGTALGLSRLPTNVRPVLHDGAENSWIRWIRGARAVVIPILPGTIASAGISTYLDAMALGVPVIITDGPAVRGLIDGEALVVPPADPVALAATMRRVWEDAQLRDHLVARGFEYVAPLQGTDRLHRDVLALALGG